MTLSRTIALSITGSLLISVTGCPFGNSRTTNQGGGTVVTAAGKVVGGQMTSLTPDEIQIVSDTISDLSPEVSLFIGDDELLTELTMPRRCAWPIRNRRR